MDRVEGTPGPLQGERLPAPEQAAQWAEGYAYLVVGAEPGSRPGTTPVDPGDLTDRVRAYVDDRIGSHPQYIDINGAKVLVIAVDPPKSGDPMHTLRKRLRNFATGVLGTPPAGAGSRARRVRSKG